MLVIGRREGERIVISGGIVIEVVRIKHGSVRLGITAPQEVVVHREEVHEAIQREHQRQQREGGW